MQTYIERYFQTNTVRDRFKLVLVFRLILTTVYLFFAFSALPRMSLLFIGAVTGSYSINIILFILTSITDKAKVYTYFGQTADTVFHLLIIYATGIQESIFIFTPILSIAASGVIFDFAECVLNAVVFSSLYAVLVILSFFGHCDPPDRLIIWNSGWEVMVYMVSLRVSVFLSSGLLAGYFSRIITFQTKQFLNLISLNENIVNNMASGLISFEEDGTVITANGAAAKLLMISPSKLRSINLFTLMPLLRKGSISRPRQFRFTYSPKRKEQRIFECGLSVFDDSIARKPIYIVSFIDTTKLQDLQKKLVSSQRVAAVGELSAAVAHEIRNPISSIRGAVELMLKKKIIDDQEKSARILMEESDRLNSIVESFVSFARNEKMITEKTEMGDFLKDIIDRYIKKTGRQVLFKPAKVPAFGKIDRLKVASSVMNMLDNAFDASTLSGDPVEVNLLKTPQGCRIIVRDTGKGMSPEDAKLAFEPFSTGKKNGLGLGLALVRKIIQAHGGTITLKSELHKGTTVTINLPAGDEQKRNGKHTRR